MIQVSEYFRIMVLFQQKILAFWRLKKIIVYGIEFFKAKMHLLA